MTGSVLFTALALGLLAGCATTDPYEIQYQIGLDGNRQTRVDAERAHAGRSLPAGADALADAAPRVLASRFPDYPQHLQRAGIDGRVVVLVDVEIDGSVSAPAVQGSPPPELAALALDAIRQWRFVPAMRNGKPERVRIQQAFLFRIED